ncbi:MAG: NTP transferase domain-containing protein [Candidatus Eiseniibacteriota bacterium]|jgi:CTP:molybdopterin cytidylyltransferase MocA
MSRDARLSLVPLVLAAGRGRRMGGPKALLELGGQTALARCLSTYAAARELLHATPTTPDAGCAALAPPLVVCAPELEADLAGRHPGLHLVPNPAPDRGQTSSVQVGLAALARGFPLAGATGQRTTTGAARTDLRPTAILVHPVDHPLVRAIDVVALVAAAAHHPDAPVILPSHQQRAGHPALIRDLLWPAILALDADAPLHSVLRPHRERTQFVACDHPGVVTDLDTPGDLAAARALWASEAQEDAGGKR